MSPIVTTNWLKQNLRRPELILLDASLPKTAEGKTAEIVSGTIPGARFFDLKKKFADPDATFPNTLPPPIQFEKECRALGINGDSLIVIFDNMGIYASPRVWWMFKAMGHKEVYVLDGGLPQWIEDGGQMASDHHESYELGNFKATDQNQMIKSYDEILENSQKLQFTLVDARSAGRFSGQVPDPRKHLKSGHIPGSINIPYKKVLDHHKFKSKEALTELFQRELGNEDQIVFSCGSGLTACIIMLASQLTGRESKVIYDGSWTEWATLQGLTLT